MRFAVPPHTRYRVLEITCGDYGGGGSVANRKLAVAVNGIGSYGFTLLCVLSNEFELA